MAGRTLMVDMADDDLIPAWRTVIELAETGISAEWTVVGGPMVAARRFRRSCPSEPTEAATPP